MARKEDFERWMGYHENNSYPCNWSLNEAPGCTGCAIAKGYRENMEELTPPGGIICERGSFLLHQDPVTPIPGFLVITHTKHKRSMIEFGDGEMKDLFSLIRDARKGLEELEDKIKMRRFTILQEERSKHFHFWLFPWPEGSPYMKKNNLVNIREIMDIAQKGHCNNKTVEKIGEILDLLRGNLS